MAPPQTLPEAAACGRLHWAVSCTFQLNLWPAVQSIPVEVVLACHEFNRCWTHLESDRGEFGRLLRLALCSAGERVPFGDDPSAAERESVAKDLRRALAAR